MGPWTVIYFLGIVLFGRFYLINLVLAVVAASYENEVQNARQVNIHLNYCKKFKASTHHLPRLALLFAGGVIFVYLM